VSALQALKIGAHIFSRHAGADGVGVD
jgi:hypothetical protein